MVPIIVNMNESRSLEDNSPVALLEGKIPTSGTVAFQLAGHKARTLSPEEAEKLAKEQVLVSDFKQLKLENDAQKNWDLFYKRNSTHFFKDRHWTTREFEELKACREVSSTH